MKRELLTVLGVAAVIVGVYVYTAAQSMSIESGLPQEAEEVLNSYTSQLYNIEAEVTKAQKTNVTNSSYAQVDELWCVTTKPVNGIVYWRAIRLGLYRWDIFPSTEAEFKELDCDIN